MATERTVRVLMAKPGLDGHDRGIKVVARALRDAGVEVVYLGMRLSVEQIADAVVQEDADVLGVHFAGADHLVLAPRLSQTLRTRGRGNDLLVVVGGIIPDDEIPQLKAMGIAEVFLPGTPLERIVEFIREHAPDRSPDRVAA